MATTQQKIQCHFISNSHWDREWRYSMQRTRYMLVHLLDMLFDIFEREPGFKSFHLDSQTIPLQDYLEVYPEKEALVKKYVQQEKLLVGPWFCLPDEYYIGGEAIIRNLLLGHKIAHRFGKVSKTGYSPFSWGQVSQMPQIYKGFGIDVISFYRGINSEVAPHSEYIWEGPDGTRIVGSRLGCRPRYNVWYVIQRPVFWNETDVGNRLVFWKTPRAPFMFADPTNCELDAQYAHPEFAYHAEHVKAFAQQAIAEQDDDWTTPHRFWSDGHDSSCPDIREARMITDCDKALGDSADVFHSTVEAWQDGLRKSVRPDWPVVRGEMRHHRNHGATSSELIGNGSSSRIHLKQDNFRTERAVTSYTEPLAVFASLLGAPYPQRLIDLAYNWMMQNHGHDSIGACARDVVSADFPFRCRQAQEISACVMERAMMDVAGSIDLSAYSPEHMALVVYNPAPFTRSEVTPLVIHAPKDWNADTLEITDQKHRKVRIQVRSRIDPAYKFVYSPNNVANTLELTRFDVLADFTDVPPMGYTTCLVKPVILPKPKYFEQPVSLLTGPQTMENEFLSVTINGNGTLGLRDKTTGKCYEGLGYFRDSGEIGNPWVHEAPPDDTIYTTLNEKATVCLVRDGALEASFKVVLNWALPESIGPDKKSRSSRLRPFIITNTVTLRKGQRWVDIVTEVENCIEDHYFRVSFPTGLKTDTVAVQSQFDVVERPIPLPDYTKFCEVLATDDPMNSFIDLSDGKAGMALLNEGLKAYGTQDDTQRTAHLTLLRGYALAICVTNIGFADYSNSDKGSQCLGKHSFHYAVMPHAGDWAEGKVWRASDQFTLALQAALIGPSKQGREPQQKSFIEMKTEGLPISAVKRSESDEGWVVRLFNPFAKEIKTAIRLNHGRTGPLTPMSPVERQQAGFDLPKDTGRPWKTVRAVTLEELPEKDLAIAADGWVAFTIAPKKILTLEFLP
jgi:alpha-mannosidase